MISRILVILVSGILLTSCGTSRSVKDLMNSYEYGIKKVHIEHVNSSYNNLVADYNESLKSENQKYSERLARDTMVHMRKGPCLGQCPVYSITIYNNGKVKYDGINFTEPKGIYESELNEAQIEKARQLISEVNLVKMYSRYPGSVDMIKDVARTNLVISDGEIKFSTVISYGEPESLKNVQEYLEQLVKELSWVQI
ncbi:DUF6438 domain-containing protein [Portibacter marinus]|uniref:DUF6438 domain-containing protein n=1 Tax=Portibacter marinus TaxID=2898660 RepID=UPI001F22BD5B|nr:DUF6438 domain-containing protein [Portibacter marinus]